MNTLNLRVKADRRHQLWLQLVEASGEAFYRIISARPQWDELSLSLEDFTLNEDKTENRRLDADRIVKIVLLDFSAQRGQTRDRTIWLSDWTFEAQKKVSTATKPSFAKSLETGKVGLTCVPRDFRETEKHWLDLLSKAQQAGVQLLSLQSGFWRESEPSPRVYNFESWDNLISILDKHGFDFELSKDIGGPFFREEIDVPRDIQFKSFTDPILLTRYKQFITAFLDRFGERHSYIVIHAEGADAYFEKYPDQFDDYCAFLEEVRRTIKGQSAHLQVGVNTDVSNTDQVLAGMAKATDFMAYDVMKGKVVRSPSDFEPLVKRLSRISAGKKIAFQNIGWSTSKTDKSSDEEQVAFIRELYRVLFRYRNGIEYASFGSMYDHDTAITGPAYRAVFPNLPSSAVEKIIDSMSHFGLFRSNGAAKPGWNEFREQVVRYYQRL
jgi:hypothetical protein